MRWIIILFLAISNATASNSDEYYDFLQPLVVNIDNNQSQESINSQELLTKFESLAKTAPKSNAFYYLNYKLMQEFQYQHFYMAIKENHKYTVEEKKIFNKNKNRFIKILKSIKKPSFFTLYSQLYLETLDSKRLKDKELIQLNALACKDKQPYVQLLSYVNSLNQLNSISIVNQNNLHKKLTLLLIGLPKKHKNYILRLTALRLLPLYDKDSIEYEFNKLFAHKSTIERDDVLHVLNYKNAELFQEYILKERRSFFEERVFKANMNALKRNDIAMILATLYMQDDNYDEARSYIRQAPRHNLYNTYNPFSSSIDLDNKKEYKKSSSLRKFAEIMARLKNKIEEKRKDRLKKRPPTARDYYLYGNGLYNKSYFGNFPMSSVFFHNEDIYKNNIPPTTNLQKAYEAYTHALKLSKKEKFKAEIAYQLLKIEFYKAITDTKNYTKAMQKVPKITDREEITHLLKASRSFVEAIKDYKLDYTHTKYGERVIKESILFSYL